MRTRVARVNRHTKNTHIDLHRYMTNAFSSLPATQKKLLNKFINVDTFFGNFHWGISCKTVMEFIITRNKMFPTMKTLQQSFEVLSAPLH